MPAAKGHISAEPLHIVLCGGLFCCLNMAFCCTGLAVCCKTGRQLANATTTQQNVWRNPQLFLRGGDAIINMYKCVKKWHRTLLHGHSPGKKGGILMKLGKWLRCAAAAGCMLFTLAMPAWADEWDISKGNITVSYQDGKQVVSQKDGETKEDAEPVFTGTGRYKQLYLDGTNGTVHATLKGFQVMDDDSSMDITPLAVDGDIELTIEDTNETGNYLGTYTYKKATTPTTNLTIKGTGSLYWDFSNIPQDEFGIDVKSLTLEGGSLIVTNMPGNNETGCIKTDALTVANSAVLTTRKGIRTQKYWIVDRDGNEWDFDKNQIQGEVIYVFYEDHKPIEVKRFPVKKYDIWVTVNTNDNPLEEIQLDSNNSSWEDFYWENGKYFWLSYDYDPNSRLLKPSSGYWQSLGVRIGKDAGDVDVAFGADGLFYAMDINVEGARNVTVKRGYLREISKAVISCSGILEIDYSNGGAERFTTLTFTQSDGKKCLLWNVDSAEEATPENAQKIGSSYTLSRENAKKYIKIVPIDDTAGGDDADDTDDIPVITAPANDGEAVVGVALGAAAVWGGYEIATRAILNNLLPDGAVIPKTQAELAVLLWNNAGQPEPVSTPAAADVDDTTAKAAQWCTEQGYLTGSFQPAKHVTKFNVIRTWNKAFPKN